MERMTISFTLMLSSEVVTLKGGRRVVLEFSSSTQHWHGDISQSDRGWWLVGACSVGSGRDTTGCHVCMRWRVETGQPLYGVAQGEQSSLRVNVSVYLYFCIDI